MANVPKLNLISLGIAVILFLLPWTDVSCNAKKVATQSGIQATYGGVTSELGPTDSKEKPDLGGSALLLIALLLVLGGAAIALLIVLKKNVPPINPAILAGVAFLLILLQAMIGFPINKVVNEKKASNAQANDEIGRMIGDAAMFSVTRTAWFYLELLALAIPAGVYGYERYSRRKAAAPVPSSPPPPS
jgi:hypothetical protein